MHLLLGILNKQLEETKKERDGYIAFEKQIKKERERDGDSSTVPADAEQRLEELKMDEHSLMDDLRDADREREALEAELRQLEREEKLLEEDEAEYVCYTLSILTLIT
jgi:beclin 1